MITQSPAAQHLVSIGYGDDVKFICGVDRYNLVPVYEKGRVVGLSVPYKPIKR
jgi:phosphosulfolactate phosphohydrolase-like enzyme